MRILFEGMWANDLEDLIQPIVSIDEYESKVDDDAVAIAFYVGDKDAADDLNRFIQKSAVPLIDSDVSPAPDQRGFYLVFAEIAANDRMAGNIAHICEEVGQLSGITDWKMSIRGLTKTVKFDIKKIQLCLLRNRMTDKLMALRNSIKALKKTEESQP